MLDTWIEHLRSAAAPPRPPSPTKSATASRSVSHPSMNFHEHGSSKAIVRMSYGMRSFILREDKEASTRALPPRPSVASTQVSHMQPAAVVAANGGKTQERPPRHDMEENSNGSASSAPISEVALGHAAAAAAANVSLSFPQTTTHLEDDPECASPSSLPWTPSTTNAFASTRSAASSITTLSSSASSSSSSLIALTPEEQARYTFFTSQIHFVKHLTDICEALRHVDASKRQALLPEKLAALNAQLVEKAKCEAETTATPKENDGVQTKTPLRVYLPLGRATDVRR
jgi:hypothetical protein